MSAYDEVISADNEALMGSEASETVLYSRPSSGVSRSISAIIERGDLDRGKDIRAAGDARRRAGRAFLWVFALVDFGGKPEYQDRIEDPDGQAWTVLQEVSRDAGLVEIAIESGIRPVL
jgi:hypothetical protein